jgi:hypothetical protein
MKNVGPESSPTEFIWTVQPIYVMKTLVQRLPLESVHCLYSNIYVMNKVGPETSSTACTLLVQAIYVKKNVGPEIFPTACTWPVKPI